MRKIIFFLLGFFLLSGLVLGSGAGFLYFKWHEKPVAANIEAKSVMIPKGIGTRKITNLLSTQGIIHHPFIFNFMLKWHGVDAYLRAGEYGFSGKDSMREVAEKLVKGDVIMHRITIAEGLTVKEVLRLLQMEDALTGEMDQTLIQEGSILPETYFFHYGDKRQALIKRMQIAMDNFMEAAWQGRNQNANLAISSMKEAKILASLIEAETGKAQERKIIASVFHNRLHKNMRLQSDPTVIYALEQQGKSLKNGLTRKDLAIDSPFNSYKMRGLPPTPINNPGKAALTAVLHPASTPYYYFVATGKATIGERGHYFAKTYKAHLKNVRLYRQQMKASNP